MGAMQEGQVLLVDDGSCPKGQIKQVVGGNHVKVGGTKQIVRTSNLRTTLSLHARLFALWRRFWRFNAPMSDTRTISQLEADGFPWIGCECRKGTVWVPFKMIRQKIPGLSAWTLDELGAKMKCDKCGKRPERYYPARQSGAPGFARAFKR